MLSDEYRIEIVEKSIFNYIKDLCRNLKIEKLLIIGIGIGIVSGFNVEYLKYILR